MDKAYSGSSARYSGKEAVLLDQLLALEKRELNGIADTSARARKEQAFAAWSHKLTKTIIPRFSLDRGFEFANVVRYGERQCFLQSVLIASLV